MRALATYIAMDLLGHPISVVDAVVIEACMLLVRALFFFVPADIGTLTVDALDANQLQITVQGVHRVGAAGQLDAIQPQVIVNLPEPGGNLLLMYGIAGLAALYRLRRQRRVTAA